LVTDPPGARDFLGGDGLERVCAWLHTCSDLRSLTSALESASTGVVRLERTEGGRAVGMTLRLIAYKLCRDMLDKLFNGVNLEEVKPLPYDRAIPDDVWSKHFHAWN
jgi:hypothetical protein